MKHVEERNKLNAKKPSFERAQSGIKGQLGGKWRKPRGLHNKTRLCKRGKRVLPAVGWGSPKAARDLEKDGTKAIFISSFKDLIQVKEGDSIRLASRLGLRKRLELLERAIQQKLTIINVKDPQKFIDESKKTIEAKKKASTKKKEDKKKKAAEADKKAEAEKKGEKKAEDIKPVKDEEKPTQQEVKADEAVKKEAEKKTEEKKQ